MKLRSAFWVSASSALIEFSTGVAADNYGAWFGQRGVQVGATIALEGGLLQYTNRSYTQADGGVYLTMDLKKPFNTSMDHTAIFTSQKDLADGNSPNYVFGSMFSTNEQWFTFA